MSNVNLMKDCNVTRTDDGKLHFLLGHTSDIPVGTKVLIRGTNTVTGEQFAVSYVTFVRKLTTQQAYALDAKMWDRVVRSLPSGSEIHWYEGESESCEESQDTAPADRSGKSATN